MTCNAMTESPGRARTLIAQQRSSTLALASRGMPIRILQGGEELIIMFLKLVYYRMGQKDIFFCCLVDRNLDAIDATPLWKYMYR